jgi:hypothetical protein
MANYADTLRRISFARRSSRTSRSSSFRRACSGLPHCPGPAPPAAPSSAASLPHRRSSRRSTEWRPPARGARPGAQTPSEPLAPEPPRNTSLACSSLHSLKARSLQQSRSDSARELGSAPAAYVDLQAKKIRSTSLHEQRGYAGNYDTGGRLTPGDSGMCGQSPPRRAEARLEGLQAPAGPGSQRRNGVRPTRPLAQSRGWYIAENLQTLRRGSAICQADRVRFPM